MFDFPTGVAALDAVPERLRVLYSEKDGAWALDEILAARLDVSGLTSALDKERKAGREAKRQLEAWAALGRGADEIAELLRAQDQALAREAERKGEIDKIRSQIGARHQAELAARDEALARTRQALEHQLVDAAATAEIAAQRGAAALLLPHLRQSLRVVEDEAGGFAVRVVDAEGKPRQGAGSHPMTVADLVAEMRQSATFGRAFDGLGISGGGTPPNSAAGGTPGAFHLTREQARDPAAYRRVREDAARAGRSVSILE